MSLENAAKAWDSEADREDRWADFLESGKATHQILPESPNGYRGRAQEYRNVALSLRMEIETGRPHCPCKNPPHPI